MSNALTQQELARFDRMLRAIVDRAAGTSAQIEGESLDRGGGGLDTQGDAGADQEFEEVDLDALAVEEGTAQAAAEALKRISSGTYGRCTGCGGEIPRGRLETVPYAPLCVSCQEAAEEA